MIILNSSKAAIDLLDKRSAIYSNRPILMMGGEIVGWNQTMALIQYGPRLREYRKFVGRLIGTRAGTEKFAPLMEDRRGYSVKEHDDPFVKVVEAAVVQFSECLEPGARLVDLVPGHFVCRTSFAGVSTGMITIVSFLPHPTPTRPECTIHTARIVRYVPSWFPGAGWKRKAERYANTLTQMAEIPYQFVKDRSRTINKHLKKKKFVKDQMVSWRL
jgi:hypothetical protein